MSGTCSSEIETAPTESQRAAVVKLGKDVGLRIDPTSIKSIDQVERIIRQLSILRARGLAPVLKNGRQLLRRERTYGGRR